VFRTLRQSDPERYHRVMAVARQIVDAHARRACRHATPVDVGQSSDAN
jgi:hypothetical protein